MSGSSGGTIADFLISIGYVEAGRKDFTAGLEDATKKAAVLGVVLSKVADAAIKAAGEITAAVIGIVKQFDDLYFVSQRTSASVQAIKSISFALSTMGSSAASAIASLEGLGHFLRTNPAGEAFIQTLGVRTRETNGQLRDMGKVFADLGDKFAKMPPWLALQYGNILGINEKDVLAMIEGAGEARKVFDDMYKSAGINAQQAARDSHVFTVEMKTLWAAVGILGDKVASVLTKQMSEDIRRLRIWLVSNFDMITKVIVWASQKFIEIGAIVTRFARAAVVAAQDIVQWWGRLDGSSRTLIETFGLILAAWYLLNRGFVLSPIGAVAALAAGLFALYEDYKTWKEGGTSLIDWGKWGPQIENALSGFNALRDALSGFADVIKDKLTHVWQRLHEVFGDFLDDVPNRFRKFFDQDMTQILENAMRGLKNVTAVLADIVKLMAAVASGDWKVAGEAAVSLSRDTGHTGADATTGKDAFSDNFVGRGMRGIYELFGGNETSTDGTPGSRFAQRLGAFGSGGTQSFRTRSGDYVNRLMKDMGLTREQASAVIGHGGHESGLTGINERNPLIPGSRGGRGWMQWTGPRRDQFEAFARERGLDLNSDETNFAFLKHDMLTTQAGRSATAALRQATTTAQGVEAFLPYETGGDPRAVVALPSRQAKAQTAFDSSLRAQSGLAAAPRTPASMEQARGLPPHALTDIERATAAGGQHINNQIELRGLDAQQPLGQVSNDNSTTHGPVLNQTTTITVNGGTADIGREIMGGQERANQNAIRVLRGSAR